jgi:hypothetical protein
MYTGQVHLRNSAGKGLSKLYKVPYERNIIIKYLNTAHNYNVELQKISTCRSEQL